MSGGAGGTVLILEDDPGVARLERLRLERAGYQTAVAATPEEALAAIQAGGVELMVLDFKLDGLTSGIDFHHQVRAAGFDLPSILVTGFGDEEMLTMALRAGIRDFLPKTPDYLDFLAPTVGRVLKQVQTERALALRQRMLTLERQRSDQLHRLAAISSRLNAARDVASVLRLVAREARGLVGARQSIASFAPGGDWSQADHAVGLDDPDAPAPYPLPDGPDAAEAARSSRPTRAGRADPGGPPPPHGAEGWLAAPLVDRQGMGAGLVQLFDKRDGGFTEDDEAVVVQLAQMASVAVENARLYQELRDNDRRKDEFLAMLAHELRNPLAAIDGAVQVGRMDATREHLDWAQEVVHRQARQLSRLIDDLLDISRINLGKIALRKEPVDLAAIVARAVEAARPAVEGRRHALSVDLPAGPLRLSGDPARLEQVLVNLLNNAAKYTPDGGRIALRARPEGPEAVVEVEDDGLGIAPEMLPRVFDAFTQVEQSLDRAQGGLGIGLTLVRRLLEMHGGSIVARSDGLGRGSTFVVRLPADGPSRQAEAPAPPTPAAGAAPAVVDARRRARILIVDDNVDTARAMARLLVASGYEVRAIHDGLEAIDAARDLRPDIFLLDIGLPGLDGYQVARAVRRDPTLADATLIAISGYGQEHDRRQSREAGFDHHLIKPVDYRALYALLDAVPRPAGAA